MREAFVFYASFFEVAQKLDEKNQLAFYNAIIKYSLTGELPELDGIADIVFTAIKPTLDTQLQNYKNGKKGGRPKKERGVSNEEKANSNEDKNGVNETQKGGFSENKKGGFDNSKSYKDKDKEKDKDKDKKEKTYKKENSSDELQTFVKVWNDYAEKYKLSKVKELTSKRKKKLKSRLRENSNFLNDFEEALKQTEYSSFLKGDTGWRMDFDWLIANDTNYVKVIEGAYKDKDTSSEYSTYEEPIWGL